MPVLEILHPTGHVQLLWNPENLESVKKAEDEFERLKVAGFAFFHDENEVDELSGHGELDVRPVVTKTLKRRGRTVARPPMVGG